jgi:hypothetical protein
MDVITSSAHQMRTARPSIDGLLLIWHGVPGATPLIAAAV